MSISADERQKRIDKIEAENKALKELNDLSEMRKRVRSERSLIEKDEAEDEEEAPLKNVALPPDSPSL